jgi:hypothetical protein
MGFPLWLILLVCGTAVAFAVAALLYVRRDDVPFGVYCPAVATSFASVATIVSFAFVPNVVLLEGTILFAFCTLLGVRRISAYRWEHGGQERYLQIKDKLNEKAARVRAERNSK